MSSWLIIFGVALIGLFVLVRWYARRIIPIRAAARALTDVSGSKPRSTVGLVAVSLGAAQNKIDKLYAELDESNKAWKQALDAEMNKELVILNIVEDLNDERDRLNQEIRLRKAIEHELQSANDELRRSNSDLDDFAYAASHDLKSPLRAIDNLAQWIAEDCEDILPAESRDDLETLRKRVSRMERLLEGLLSYAQIGRTEDKSTLIDLQSLVSNIVELLDKPANFEITQEGTSISFEGFSVPLALVLRNLISNAINHRERDNGKVVVKAGVKDSVLTIAVCDDGPGVPEDQQEKIFGLFATLGSKDESNVNGLGLAMVKKAVERLRGVVEVRNNESAPGCSFIVSLPIAKYHANTGTL